jgi:hypothetical protein
VEDFDAYVIGCWADWMVTPPYVPTVIERLNLANKFVLTFNCHAGDGGLIKTKFNQMIASKSGKHVDHLAMKFASNYFVGKSYPKDELHAQGVKKHQLLQIEPAVTEFYQICKGTRPYTPIVLSCGQKTGNALFGNTLQNMAKKPGTGAKFQV